MRHVQKTKPGARRREGFTLIEVLIASLIMIIIVVGALSIYVKSNRTATDQQQYVQTQQDVRAAMYYLSRDVRMAGQGLPSNFLWAAVQGTDNENQGETIRPDRVRFMGNIEEPLRLSIQKYMGSSSNTTLLDFSLEQNTYPDSYYIGKIVMVFPNPNSTCTGAAFRQISSVRHSAGGTLEGFDFAPGQAPGINPPGGLSDVCASDDYDGGTIMFCDVYDYWLDITGSYPGLTAGQAGYIGGGTGGVLYQNRNGINNALAMNIEDLQVQYNGNFDGDAGGTLDGFTNWNSAWTAAQISCIRQVRLWVVGQTPTRFVSISAASGSGPSLYRHPGVANSAAGTADDGRKRFVLETTINVRNMSLNLYNVGVR